MEEESEQPIQREKEPRA